MKGFFLEYSDPLFGIIIFVSIIFLLTLLTHLWNIYKLRYKNEHITTFVSNFRSTDKPQIIKNLLDNKDLPIDVLLLLANNYFKASQYGICIEICIDTLKRSKNSFKKEILLLLAQAYYKAGFYKRSEITLIELLRHNTREPKAVKYLVIIYEKLHRFNEAIDALNSLKEMQYDVCKDISYIHVSEVIYNSKLSLDEKSEKLIQFYRQEPKMIRPIFIYLFRNNSNFAWKNIPINSYKNIIDILWNLPKEALDFDIISKHKELQALWFAKGFCRQNTKSDIFELNVLNTLIESGQSIASLEFNYQCCVCKEITLSMSHRCQYCLELLSLDVEIHVVQSHTQNHYYSF